MKNNNSLTKKIHYILSVFLFLCTIVFFPSIASILFLIIGIMLLPNIWNKLTTFINKKILIIICIFLFLVSCSISPIKNNNTITTINQNNVANNILTNTSSSLDNEINNTITNTSSNNTAINTNETTKNATTKSNNVSQSSPSNSKPTNSKTSNTTNSYNSTPQNNVSKKTKNDNTSRNSETGDTVWITKSGKKYHKQNCPTLKGNGYAISLSEAQAQGKEPCKVCYK